MDSQYGELEVDVLDRASARALAAQDPMLGLGNASDAQVAEIVRRGIPLVDQINPEDLFTWTIQAINNKTFAYAMWMDETSLRNFVSQAVTGRGIPYLRNHNVAQDTTGRVFYATLIEDGPEQEHQSGDGVIPTFRDLFRDRGPVLRVLEQVFMVRGLVLDGLSTDDYIKQIEYGIQASNSIGWAFYGPLEPGSYVECDHCKVDLLRADFDECPHFPGLEYAIGMGDGEDRETIAALATARIVNARQREVSGVYLGAVPDTFTERGRQLHAAGHMSMRQARHLETQLQLTRGRIVGDEQSISIPPASRKPTESAAAPARGPHPDGGKMDTKQLLARIRELLAGDADLVAGLDLHDPDKDPLAALVGLLREERRGAARQLSEAESRHDAFKARIAERIGADEGETLDAALTRFEGATKIAGQVRTRLVAELARQMTRSGMPAQPEEAEKLAVAWDLDQIEAQTARHKKAGDKLQLPGSVGRTEIHDRHEADDDEPLRPSWARNGTG